MSLITILMHNKHDRFHMFSSCLFTTIKPRHMHKFSMPGFFLVSLAAFFLFLHESPKENKDSSGERTQHSRSVGDVTSG